MFLIAFIKMVNNPEKYAEVETSLVLHIVTNMSSQYFSCSKVINVNNNVLTSL